MPALLRDSAIPSWKSVAQVLVAGLAFIAFPAGAEESDDEPPDQYVIIETINLHLEEDQYEAGDTLRSHLKILGYYSDTFSTSVHLKLSSAHQTGPYEVEISLSEIDFESTDWETDWEISLIDKTGPTPLDYQLALPAKRTIKGSKDHPEMVYREIFNENPKEYLMWIEALNPRLPLSYGDLTYTLEVKLRRVDYCTMWAKISGGVDSVTYGDVAYFNTFDQPTKVATGSISDPEMIDMIGDMVEGMAEMFPGSTAGTEEAGSSGSAMREDWEDFVRKENEGGTEGWGLSLVDSKKDSDFTALETLLGGLTIEAAGPGSIQTSEYGHHVFLTLSRLDVVPGMIDPNTGDRIKFTWREGQPGNALLVLGSASEHFISGEIKGELYSEKEYDGRKLRISVEAKFAALRGALACQR